MADPGVRRSGVRVEHGAPPTLQLRRPGGRVRLGGDARPLRHPRPRRAPDRRCCAAPPGVRRHRHPAHHLPGFRLLDAASGHGRDRATHELRHAVRPLAIATNAAGRVMIAYEDTDSGAVSTITCASSRCRRPTVTQLRPAVSNSLAGDVFHPDGLTAAVPPDGRGVIATATVSPEQHGCRAAQRPPVPRRRRPR
jgi:hypothetical protein